MLPLTHSDVTAAARAVLAVPAPGRKAFCLRLVRDADWADRFTRRIGRPHPLWGNGTLGAAARAHVLAREPTFDDSAYCTAFEMVLSQLLARRHLAEV